MIIKDLYYKFRYVDEVTARGVLDSMNDNLVVSYTVADLDYPKVWTQTFIIDEFNILISFSLDKSLENKFSICLTLMVDELELICSDYIKEKIWDKASTIYNKEKNKIEADKLEEERMLRKDIKLRFGGKL